MALISLRQLLDHAAEHGYGLPAFNVNNMEPTEQVQTIMRAADAVDSPVILQDSAGARSYAGEPFLRHLIEAEVENYPHILVCMHQDHCASPDICLCSIQSGFSSVVMDGQGAEDKLAMDQLPTDPDEAVDFVNKTGLDALAIAIGTSHGAYKFTREPTGKIQHIDRVKEIHQRIPGVHLVMHASSSMPQDWMKIINSYGGVMGQTYGVPVEEIVESIKSSTTLGSATDDPKVLDALLHAGMDVVRINLSHDRHDAHRNRAETLRGRAWVIGRQVGVLADLQGPKIRIGRFREGAIELADGVSFCLVAECPLYDGDKLRVGMTYTELVDDVSRGATLLLDDGAIQLWVKDVQGSRVHCKVVVGGELTKNNGINKQGSGLLSAPALTVKDREDIRSAARIEAVSAVRSADDVCAVHRLMGETGGQSASVAKIERAEAFDVPKAVMDGTDADMLLASTPGEPSMDNLKKQRHLHGMSEWYQAKGPYHYADWELEQPRDNHDITTIVPTGALTDPERALDDAKRLGVDIPGGWEQEKLTEELVRVQNESEKAYRSWARQVSMVVNSAKKSWRMPKRFIFHCCFLNQHEEITLLELNALVDSCFPLIRDRRSVMKRALNLSLSNSQRLRLTNRVLAELAGRSANQVVNYKRQIKDELGDLLRPLSQDPARYL